MTDPDTGAAPVHAAPAAGPAARPSIRRAQRADLAAIVRLLADDPLGASRERPEDPLPASYGGAFEAIDRDPNNELVVACGGPGEVLAVLQLTFIPYLTHQGCWRAMIEGVRVDSRLRGQGVGRFLLLWAIERARERGCGIVQLTTNKARPDALRFYQQLGFVASHEGLKLDLAQE